MQIHEMKSAVNTFLDSLIPESEEKDDGLSQAMRYSLMAGGKRIRPILSLMFAEMLGANLQEVLPVACAIELVHTYSLIHDDLPCMDNDTLRRGKPTNHVVFGECTATLAGDALQALAFETILASGLSADRTAKCALLLARAAGFRGMCLGQYLDMLGENRQLSTQELDRINNGKTGAMLAASCEIGVAAAGGTEAQITAAGNFGRKLGLAFQIRDDILDVISTPEKLGKTIGSDVEEHKNTYMVLLGSEKCEQEIEKMTDAAVDSLNSAFEGCDIRPLAELARSLQNRTS